MADKSTVKNATKSAVSKVCDINGREVILNNQCRSAEEDAHRSRNEFQKNVCPTNLSKTGEGYDKSTGINWTRDLANIPPIPYFTGYHIGEKCYRGKPTIEQNNAIKQNENFRKNVEILGGNSDNVIPGFQCCYKSDGTLSPSSSFDYDYSGGDHKKLDMNPHDKFKVKPDGTEFEYGGYDEKDFKEMSSGKDIEYITSKEIYDESEEMPF